MAPLALGDELADGMHVDSSGRKDEDETCSVAARLIRRPRKAKCMPGARTKREKELVDCLD